MPYHPTSRERRDMPIEPVNLVALVGTVLGISVVLIPVIGITARFALRPTVEALSRLFESRNTNEALQIVERRLELQEQQIDALQAQLRRLTEADEFDRQLAAPRRAEGLPSSVSE